MHVSPAKHSYAWLRTKVRLPDRQTHGQTDAGQSDPYVSLCFAGNTKMHRLHELICFIQSLIVFHSLWQRLYYISTSDIPCAIKARFPHSASHMSLYSAHHNQTENRDTINSAITWIAAAIAAPVTMTMGQLSKKNIFYTNEYITPFLDWMFCFLLLTVIVITFSCYLD